MQGVTGGYKCLPRLQRVKKDYRGLEGARRSYRELPGVKKGHKYLKRVTGG